MQDITSDPMDREAYNAQRLQGNSANDLSAHIEVGRSATNTVTFSTAFDTTPGVTGTMNANPAYGGIVQCNSLSTTGVTSEVISDSGTLHNEHTRTIMAKELTF